MIALVLLLTLSKHDAQTNGESQTTVLPAPQCLMTYTDGVGFVADLRRCIFYLLGSDLQLSAVIMRKLRTRQERVTGVVSANDRNP